MRNVLLVLLYTTNLLGQIVNNSYIGTRIEVYSNRVRILN